ncbi:MAG: trigger factor [Xanthomonadales bacterium]|nr:trigger factor [Xanthomonadales bacterium]
MQVSVENISTVETRLKIQVPAEEVKKQIDARLREIGKQVRLKGFRPGRIPFSVLNQRYGPQAKQEVIQQTAQSALQQAVEQESLRIAANPRVESEPVLDDSGLQIDAIIEIYPELASIDVSEIAIERPDVSVVDDDVAEMLETLKKQRIKWNDVDRSPVDGDQALIEYTAQADEETIPEEGNLRLAIILGESGFETLEKALRKMSPGDEKKLKLEFPADFREPALAGKKAEMALTLSTVQESEIPEIDEEFTRSFGVDSGEVEELKTEIRKNLERELGQAVSTQLKAQLADRLLEMHPDLEVPASIVNNEAQNMLQQMLRGAKLDITSEMLDHFKEPATKRVRSGLLLAEIAQQNKIKIDGPKVREAIELIAQTYEEPQEVVKMYYSDQRLLQSVENSVLEDQVVDWVVNNAKVTDKSMSFQEVINAATQAAGQ